MGSSMLKPAPYRYLLGATNHGDVPVLSPWPLPARHASTSFQERGRDSGARRRSLAARFDHELPRLKRRIKLAAEDLSSNIMTREITW